MSNASEYADRLIATIWADHETGFPFGMVSDDNPVLDRENGEEVSAMDYLTDVLDIHYTVNGDGEYLGARVCVGFGGPNVWIDTRDRELIVTWGSAPERRSLPVPFCDGLDEALSELWECR